mgnify:FL=1
MYLISETTKEEREAIVKESLGHIEASCDGCMSGLAEMYQDYIDGKKELREINMEFNARYVHGEDMPGRSGCGYKKKTCNPFGLHVFYYPKSALSEANSSPETSSNFMSRSSTVRFFFSSPEILRTTCPLFIMMSLLP